MEQSTLLDAKNVDPLTLDNSNIKIVPFSTEGPAQNTITVKSLYHCHAQILCPTHRVNNLQRVFPGLLPKFEKRIQVGILKYKAWLSKCTLPVEAENTASSHSSYLDTHT